MVWLFWSPSNCRSSPYVWLWSFRVVCDLLRLSGIGNTGLSTSLVLSLVSVMFVDWMFGLIVHHSLILNFVACMEDERIYAIRRDWCCGEWLVFDVIGCVGWLWKDCNCCNIVAACRWFNIRACWWRWFGSIGDLVFILQFILGHVRLVWSMICVEASCSVWLCWCVNRFWWLFIRMWNSLCSFGTECISVQSKGLW